MSDEIERPEGGEEPERPGRKRPGRLRRWVVRPFVWGLLLLGLLIVGLWLLVQSRYARSQLAGRLIAAVSEKIGRQVQVGDLDYTVFPLALELRDVVIPGPTPADPPVARVPLARVEASWRDLRQRVLRLEQVEAINPEIYIRVAPDGSTNLPRWRTEAPRGPRRFEVQIGRILVQNGTLRLNEQRLPLSVDARALWARVIGQAERGGEGGERLDALVTAQEVVTRLPDAQPWKSTVSAKGSIFPREGKIRLTSARFAGPDLRARTDGWIEWRGDKRVALAIEAEGATPLLNRLGYLKEPIEGPFTFRGRTLVQGKQIEYSGTIGSPRVAILGREFRGIQAELSGGRESLEVDLRRAEYAGGTIEGPINVPFNDGGNPGTPVELDLTLAGLGLQPLLQDQFPGEDFPVVSNLAGRVRGTLAYDFDSRAPLAGSGFADLRVEAAHRQSRLPLSGDLPIEIEEGVLTSDDLRITGPGQDLRVTDFRFDLQRLAGRLGYRLESRDLGRLAPLLLEDVPPGEDPPFWLPNQGQGTLAGTVDIDRSDYSALVRLDLRNAVTPDLTAEVARGSLRISPRAVDNLDLSLVSGPGSLTVAGRVPLAEEGQTVPTEPMDLRVLAERWQAGSVVGFLLPAETARSLDVEGELTGGLNLRGFPEALQGEAEASVARLTVSGQPVGDAQMDVAFEGSLVRLRRASIQTEAGLVLIAGTFAGGPAGQEGSGTLDFTLDAPSLALAQPPFRDLLGGRLGGNLAIGAVVGGTLDRPEATVRVVGTQLELAGRPLGQPGAAGENGTAQALIAWDGDTLRATGSLLGLISFDGGGRLDQAGADLAFDVSSDDLDILARLASPQVPDFAGSFLGTLGFTADFAREAWQAELRLADLRAEYEGHRINNLEPVILALGPDRLAIRSLYLGEPQTETELFASGTVGLAGEEAPLDLRLQSTVSAVWAELFVPDLDVEGYVDLLATVRGTLGDPVLNGQGEIRDARIVIPNFPHELEDVRGTLLFNRDAIELEGGRARVGGGQVFASGRLPLPRAGAPLEYRFQVSADDLSLRYPEGFLARGDANLSLIATGPSRTIRGEVRLDRLFYLEDVEVGTLELLRGAFERERLQVAETDEFLATTQLNIQISGDDALRVNNNVARLRGDLDLFVRGTLASPVLFGQVELTSGGRLVYADNEYEVERGLLTFNNPYRIDPVIDLVATTEVRNFDITLSLSGTLERLNAQFSSEEGLADLEILALLATGQELEQEGRIRAPGERSPEMDVRASEILAGQAASLVSKRVGTLFGFDRFRIDPQANATGGAIGGVRLTVGKRISRDLFVTYSSNPAASEEYLVRMEWQVADNVVLVFTRDGEDDTWALDAEWERRF